MAEEKKCHGTKTSKGLYLLVRIGGLETTTALEAPLVQLPEDKVARVRDTKPAKLAVERPVVLRSMLIDPCGGVPCGARDIVG